MFIKKKSAIMIFYYLIAVDMNVSDEEMFTFESIANEIDPEFYWTYKGSINVEYTNQVNRIIDEEDFYDVVLEGVDKEIFRELDEEEQGVSPRLLLWNLFVIALCDGEYTNEQRRLIKHIVRMLDIELDIFYEMEHLMKANVAVGKELESIEKSDKPYNEIRPLVVELEKRCSVILIAAKNLIEDELYIPVNKLEIPKNKVIENTKGVVGKAAANVANVVSPLANPVTPIAYNINNQKKKLLGNIKTNKHKHH